MKQLNKKEGEIMSNKHEGRTRGFIQTSKARYYKNASGNNQDNIYIGFYSAEGGTSSEFKISWEDGLTPILIIYGDSWSALSNFRDLIEAMASVDNKKVSPGEFVSILESLGIENMTPIERKQTGD